jgi:HNH endonuclease
MTECTDPDCHRPTRCRGLCGLHYQRWRKTCDPAELHPKIRRTCTVDDCPKPVHGHGLCDLHYLRLKRHGDLESRRVPTGSPCLIEGCDRLARHRGWCSTHYERWRVHGDPLARPRGPLNPKYYRLVASDGRRIFEHRAVMEGLLGRPLTRQEHVHHRNGQRHDNRPANLELWTSHHPNGQSINDMLAWCRWYTRTYAPIARKLARAAEVDQLSLLSES